jgi:hypothetical protein
LVQDEHAVQRGVNLIANHCTSKDLQCKVDGAAVSPEFAAFLQRVYIPFGTEAIKLMCIVGFVPWR